MEGPNLPSQFPCWCKALYSWGGESKRDLGFIEGDYIECLNPGDGQWWTGRLKRDKRMIGLFPCNFVKVLDEQVQEALRNAASSPRRNGAMDSPTPPASANGSPQKNKSMFRRPFSAHAAAEQPNPQAAARHYPKSPVGTPSPNGSLNGRYVPKPYSSMRYPQDTPTPPGGSPLRPPSPRIPQPPPRGAASQPYQPTRRHSRAPSPQPHHMTHGSPSPTRYNSYREPTGPPQQQYIPSRGHSPAPMQDTYNYSSFSHHQQMPLRSRSPAPYSDVQEAYTARQEHYVSSRGPSPTPFEDTLESTPPPPPPPTHRHAYSAAPSPSHHSRGREVHQANAQHRTHTPSPAPSQRTGHTGMTPSPLRDAMNDVMESLDSMGLEQESSPEHHEDPHAWSPDVPREAHATSVVATRPKTSQGFAVPDMHYGREANDGLQADPYESFANHMEPDQMNAYVQRMESRIARIKQEQVPDIQPDVDPRDNAMPPPRRKKSLLSRAPSIKGLSRHGTLKSSMSRPASSYGTDTDAPSRSASQALRHRKSAYELGRDRLARTFTTKSTATVASSTAQSSSTNNSNSTQLTEQSLMSGHSAGGFSATSAGSLARRFGRRGSTLKRPQSMMEVKNPENTLEGFSYHDEPDASAEDDAIESNGLLGGLSTPHGTMPKKGGLFRKMKDLAKTGAAGARSNITTDHVGSERPRPKSALASVAGSVSNKSVSSRNVARSMGLGGGGSGVDWMQMRRDVNRSNSLSRNEKSDRRERCQMQDLQVMCPVDLFNETVEGDEDQDGFPIADPTDYANTNLTLVDKHARFISNFPHSINPFALAQNYICRPYRSEVQRLRAIFTWVCERIQCEESCEYDVDTTNVVRSKRGSSQEIACLVSEMCQAMGIYAEVVRGYLKTPGEDLITQDVLEVAARPNHWWNAVVVDGEWRILDCALASPSNPRRAGYSTAGNQVADTWWFLARPMDICYTHVALLPEHQHIVEPVDHEVLMSLPVACPTFFKHSLKMFEFDTSMLHLEGLEQAHIQFTVPDNVECVAEVETRSLVTDPDGDYFESGDSIKKRALAQAEFVSRSSHVADSASVKRYTVKALLPSQRNVASNGVLHIYAGQRGLMHGINRNPHSLAFTLPLVHDGGENPDYDFFTRHPTPHALRHELYVTNPLCKRLAMNNTFVFCVRQHPANPNIGAASDRAASPLPTTRPGSALSMARPSSAMSMTSVSVSGSAYSMPSSSSNGSNDSKQDGLAKGEKPAKLAIQSPSGKIMKMRRKPEPDNSGAVGARARMTNGTSSIRNRSDDVLGGLGGEVQRLGSTWEVPIKIGERGVWRGLVLADRSARWCVFGEWECV
ncbi:MAG: cytokinesis protein 3 [Chrysothrix sp. TS-e1954]|nr:MAG: cytokinesis protein 3 [Chrysothrix sp. TS-e1954]